MSFLIKSYLIQFLLYMIVFVTKNLLLKVSDTKEKEKKTKNKTQVAKKQIK